jgi:hypothetical protein
MCVCNRSWFLVFHFVLVLMRFLAQQGTFFESPSEFPFGDLIAGPADSAQSLTQLTRRNPFRQSVGRGKQVINLPTDGGQLLFGFELPTLRLESPPSQTGFRRRLPAGRRTKSHFPAFPRRTLP